ncbi:methyltransferase family protein [Photobacterium galatheae]|uniref:Protein-S-isoprenylcysteine methyltransferase n=1 Tax=Photobacterium galatheae TaxID=1654360 RepID=A0A066RUQ9_9GAMM|nr:isoprenylcysteine carboxylmethyltransferase family protein [Photobacterium galatheae]KDM91113.1 protein-S-isoprenylcysteine methyltransferase [Photobacterium galatheae]MCM0150165.1 isoprenylcysteine carboxylmethyltransferase family protein [Photobacterium galatheae]
MQTLENKIPPLVVMGIFSLLMGLLSPYLPSMALGVVPSVSVALLIAIFGCWFAASGVKEFRKSKTTVNPRQPENASELVVSGVYQRSRNPMYVGFASLLVAQAVYLQSPFLFFGVIAFILYMNRFQILPEERAMIQCFGEKYLRYQMTVRRWL